MAADSKLSSSIALNLESYFQEKWPELQNLLQQMTGHVFATYPTWAEFQQAFESKTLDFTPIIYKEEYFRHIQFRLDPAKIIYQTILSYNPTDLNRAYADARLDFRGHEKWSSALYNVAKAAVTISVLGVVGLFFWQVVANPANFFGSWTLAYSAPTIDVLQTVAKGVSYVGTMTTSVLSGRALASAGQSLLGLVARYTMPSRRRTPNMSFFSKLKRQAQQDVQASPLVSSSSSSSPSEHIIDIASPGRTRKKQRVPTSFVGPGYRLGSGAVTADSKSRSSANTETVEQKRRKLARINPNKRANQQLTPFELKQAAKVRQKAQATQIQLKPNPVPADNVSQPAAGPHPSQTSAQRAYYQRRRVEEQQRRQTFEDQVAQQYGESGPAPLPPATQPPVVVFNFKQANSRAYRNPRGYQQYQNPRARKKAHKGSQELGDHLRQRRWALPAGRMKYLNNRQADVLWQWLGPLPREPGNRIDQRLTLVSGLLEYGLIFPFVSEEQIKTFYDTGKSDTLCVQASPGTAMLTLGSRFYGEVLVMGQTADGRRFRHSSLAEHWVHEHSKSATAVLEYAVQRARTLGVELLSNACWRYEALEAKNIPRPHIPRKRTKARLAVLRAHAEAMAHLAERSVQHFPGDMEYVDVDHPQKAVFQQLAKVVMKEAPAPNTRKLGTHKKADQAFRQALRHLQFPNDTARKLRALTQKYVSSVPSMFRLQLLAPRHQCKTKPRIVTLNTYMLVPTLLVYWTDPCQLAYLLGDAWFLTPYVRRMIKKKIPHHFQDFPAWQNEIDRLLEQDSKFVQDVVYSRFWLRLT